MKDQQQGVAGQAVGTPHSVFGVRKGESVGAGRPDGEPPQPGARPGPHELFETRGGAGTVGEGNEVRATEGVEQPGPGAVGMEQFGVRGSVAHAQCPGAHSVGRGERATVVGQGELLLVLAPLHARRIELGDASPLRRGQAQDTGGDRLPLGLVGVQQCRVRSGEDPSELPAEVVSVLHARVEALRAGRGVDVRGVTGEEDPSAAVALRQADVGPEHRRPVDVVQLDAAVAGVVVDPPEDCVFLRGGFFVRCETDHPLEHVAVGQRTGADELAAQARPHMPPVTGQPCHRSVDDEHPVALVRRPDEPDAELLAHRTGTTVGAHDEAGHDLLRAVRTRDLGDHGVLVLSQFGQLTTELISHPSSPSRACRALSVRN